MKKLKDKKILALIIGIAILFLVLVGILFSCGENDSSKSEKEQNKVESVTTTEETEKDKNKDEKEAALEDNKEDTEDTEEKIDKGEKLSEKEATQKSEANTQSETDSSDSNKTTDNKTTASNHTHTWVAEYKTVPHPAETKQVWVVDKEAYTEEVPVYETKYVNVCNESSCDIDFYGWKLEKIEDHLYNHVIKGEKSGYHKEYRDVLTGYNTVPHPEEGHYNTVVVKEAYTEEVLSGYKCSCGATK